MTTVVVLASLSVFFFLSSAELLVEQASPDELSSMGVERRA